MNRMRRLAAAAALLAGLALTAGTSTALAGSVGISIADFAFSPATITVKVGTVVTWTNTDPAPHTVTSDTAGVLDSGVLNTSETFSKTFTTAGTIAYHCNIHPSMHGTLVVEAAAPTDPPGTTQPPGATQPPPGSSQPPTDTATPGGDGGSGGLTLPLLAALAGLALAGAIAGRRRLRAVDETRG